MLSRSRARCFALAVGLTLAAGAVAAATDAATTIAVDVGHSASEPGATSARGVRELTFNRALAAALAQALGARGVAVVMIGEDGRGPDLRARADAAATADLLLSIHHDSVQPRYLMPWEVAGAVQRMSRRFAGFSLFVSRRNPRFTASLRCASAIGAALRAAGFVPSRHHAEPIPGENRPFADRRNGVHYFDELILLRKARVPAVLLEAGVIVHPEEETRLRDPATVARLATAVAEGAACLGGGNAK